MILGLKAVVTVDALGAIQDEWVLPSFFTTNSFIGMTSFKPCGTARISQNFDPDMCLEAFKKQYPGSPRDMLSEMILNLVVKLYDTPVKAFKENAVVRPVTGNNSASLVASETGEILVLWENMNPEKYL